MAAPFYNAIKGSTAAAPGTGAFTPNAASAGFLAWSSVHAGWVGLVRFEDGAAWELRYGYWDGATITRPSAAFVASSTGSGLTLTSSATASLIVDAADVQPSLGTQRFAFWNAIAGQLGLSIVGSNSVVVTGTNNSASLSSANYLAEQPRAIYTSDTTANAQAGVNQSSAQALYSTTARRGGFEVAYRFGATTLPTGPRFFCGASGINYAGSVNEPSAHAAQFVALAKDSTDTNFQFMSNNGTTAGKLDTGIPWVANAWYEVLLSIPPGGGRADCRFFRMDDPSGTNIWFGSRTTNLPDSGSLLAPLILGGLNGTNTGTALNLALGSMVFRTGG